MEPSDAFNTPSFSYNYMLLLQQKASAHRDISSNCPSMLSIEIPSLFIETYDQSFYLSNNYADMLLTMPS